MLTFQDKNCFTEMYFENIHVQYCIQSDNDCHPNTGFKNNKIFLCISDKIIFLDFFMFYTFYKQDIVT